MIKPPRLYNSSSLSGDEVPFKEYFEQLTKEFDSEYNIIIINKDFSRTIAAGVMNRTSEVGVTIYFKYGSHNIFNPINATVLKQVRDHFSSGATKDLEIF